MKKVLSLALVIVMCFAFVACGGSASDKVAKYVEDNREELVSSMEASFATSSGMTCESDIEAIDAGFVITIKINELDDVPDETKELLQDTYDSMNATFEGMLDDFKKEVPELEYFTINVCDKDGEVLAVVTAGK